MAVVREFRWQLSERQWSYLGWLVKNTALGAKRLKKHGFKETEASVTNKLKRGTFPATWFLAVLAALELDGVALEEI